MQNLFFTSDLHFNHNNVITYCNRPYRDIEHMNEMLITNWNKVVGPGDAVYCLGDLSLAIRPIELYSARLQGTKYLVPGNHDWCHPYNKKARTPDKLLNQTSKYEALGWKVLPTITELVIGNMQVVLSHLPYTNIGDVRLDTIETGYDKYASYRPKNTGKWLLCGHVHEKWKVQDKMINVGVDVWDYKPVSLDQILELIK